MTRHPNAPCAIGRDAKAPPCTSEIGLVSSRLRDLVFEAQTRLRDFAHDKALSNVPLNVVVASLTMTSARRVGSPLGSLVIRCTPFGLESLSFGGDPAVPETAPAHRRESELLDQAAAWLKEYFASPGQAPRAPRPALAATGTAFEREVWRALAQLPFGEVVTYGDIARQLGRSLGTCRAVGQANGKNPLPIFVPCHRVIAAGGKLGGFSAGLERKMWLLAHEGVHAFAAPAPIPRAESYGVF